MAVAAIGEVALAAVAALGDVALAVAALGEVALAAAADFEDDDEDDEAVPRVTRVPLGDLFFLSLDGILLLFLI